MLESAYAAWLTDTRSGKTSLLIAGDNTTVTELNQRAHFDPVGSGEVEADGITVGDDTTIGVGDRIVTRRNNRGLTDGNNWVRNGDTFTVIGRSESGALTVRRHPNDDAEAGVLVLPPWYVTKHTRLAYATTAHRAQVATVDTAHTIVTTGLSREKLYVSMSRGRTANRAYVALDAPGEDPDDARHHQRPASGVEVLRAVLAHSDAEVAATETSASARRSAESMATLRAIRQRATHLVDQARRNVEPWLDHVGPEPSDPQKRPAWQTAAEAIATYRERWTITDRESLGKHPGRDRAQRRDHARAQRAIDARQVRCAERAAARACGRCKGPRSPPAT